MNENPLLSAQRLPPFDRLHPSQVPGAVEAIEAEVRAGLARLEEGDAPGWDALIPPLDALTDRLDRAEGLIHLLASTRDDQGWGDAAGVALPRLRTLAQEVHGSQALYPRLIALAEGARGHGLTRTQRRAIEVKLRQARLAGAELVGEDAGRFRLNQARLEVLRVQFAAALQAERRAWHLTVEDPHRIAGMPEAWRQVAAEHARACGHPHATAVAGPWTLVLDWTSLGPVLQHAADRGLRHAARGALSRHGAGEGDDNRARALEMLRLREEQAALLSHASWACLVAKGRMAGSPDEVRQTLTALDDATADAALRERAELAELAERLGAAEAIGLEHADFPFWRQRLAERLLGHDAAALRAYLPVDRVLEGAFDLLERLLGMALTPVDGRAPVWHPDVRLVEVRDSAGGAILGHLYLDLFARPGSKAGGAWMRDIVTRSRALASDGEPYRRPVGVVVANLSPPTDGAPSLLSLDDVGQLLHELGHAAHTLLTEIDELSVAGANGVEWDAVEIPSMFMEAFAHHRPTLERIGRHHETGAPIPPELLDAAVAHRGFRGATPLRGQLAMAWVDLELHARPAPEDVPALMALDRQLRAQAWLHPLPEDEAWLASFAHVFVGPYAAGVYTYLWSEILASEIFAAFEACATPQEEAALGRRLRALVLAQGGARPAADLIQGFLGREPGLGPMLERRGILPRWS